MTTLTTSISSQIAARLETAGVKAKPKTLAAFRSLRKSIVQAKSPASVARILEQVAEKTPARSALGSFVRDTRETIKA